MDRLSMASLIVGWFILIIFPFTIVYADYQGDALYALRQALDDPNDYLITWDNTLVDPSTWFHVTWNDTSKGVERIDLGDSMLSGPLVPELGNLDKLKYLELHDNKINGPIPKELGNLANLVSLDLNNNNLTGPIPEELGKLTNLRFLHLNDNNLSGRIPVHELAKISASNPDVIMGRFFLKLVIVASNFEEILVFFDQKQHSEFKSMLRHVM
ncbi:protein kinase superfamily [Castilleja foliolosa]|uniref:Protein kinase superfamily n=1 Tax=Castilleja foliolosa TaxID=1961234 RepID=A0ABD3BW77_9LAMI